MLVQQVLVHGVPFGTGNKQAAAVIFHFVKVLRQYADLVAAGDLKIGQTHFVAGKRCRSIRKAEQRNDDMAVKPKAEPVKERRRQDNQAPGQKGRAFQHFYPLGIAVVFIGQRLLDQLFEVSVNISAGFLCGVKLHEKVLASQLIVWKKV